MNEQKRIQFVQTWDRRMNVAPAMLDALDALIAAEVAEATKPLVEALEDVKIWMEESGRSKIVPVLYSEVCAVLAKRGTS